MYQCYFTDKEGKRCAREQADCWCSSEHEQVWKSENYQDFRPKGEHKLSVEEMQKRLKEMGKSKKFEKQQELL